MPLYDKINLNLEYIRENIEYSFLAKYLMPWGKSIPQDIFYKFVLPYRVTQEPVERFRKKFFEELGEKVHNLSMKEAVLFISKWSYEKAIYKPTEPWDSGALTTIKLGYGRCEEKAILLIDALRSVSIPARLVFTPAWQHANGNHAWVEVWINGKWNVLEIAKPVKILNHPWFEANYSVMPAVYTYVYGKGLKNITKNYNPSICRLKIKSNNIVFVSIFNSGMLRPVGVIKGKPIDLGYGSYLLSSKNGIKLIECNKPELNIDNNFTPLKSENFSFVLKYPLPLKVKRMNIYDTHEIEKIDKNRKKKTFNKNFKKEDNLFKIYIKKMSDKDFIQFRIKDFYKDYKLALKLKRKFYNNDIFINYVLNPRIYFENLELWRNAIFKKFKFKNLSVNEIINKTFNYVNSLKKVDKKDTGPILGPLELLKSEKYRNETEVKMLIVAILRTFGIPAKFNISGKFIEIYINSKWQFLKTDFDDYNKLKKLNICWKNFFKNCYRNFNYDRDFTLAFFKKGYFQSLRFLNGNFNSDSCCWQFIEIPDKNYFLITGKRLNKNSTEVNLFKINH